MNPAILLAAAVVAHEPGISADAALDAANGALAEHSFRKAYTALTYRMTSVEVGKRPKSAKGANE